MTAQHVPKGNYCVYPVLPFLGSRQSLEKRSYDLPTDFDMKARNSVTVDGKEYTWDGQVFRDKNKVKATARRYLRQGFKVHMEAENGNFCLYTHRPFSWKEYSVK